MQTGDWSPELNNPSGTAVKAKKWQSRKYRNSPLRSTYRSQVSKSILRMEIFLQVYQVIFNINTL